MPLNTDDWLVLTLIGYHRVVQVKGYSALVAMIFGAIFSVTGAQSDGVRISVAGILADRAKLNQTVVTLRGRLDFGRETDYFGDESECTGKLVEPCALYLAYEKCRIAGSRYASVECSDAIRRLLADAGFSYPPRKPVFVKGVVITGVFSTRASSTISSGKDTRPPRVGGGQPEALPGQIDARFVNLDEAEVITTNSLPYWAGRDLAEPSLYIRSLKACAQAWDPKVRDDGVITVLENDIVTDPAYFFPAPLKADAISFQYMDAKALQARSRQTGKEVDAIEVKPMVNWRDELVVDCTNHRVNTRKKMVTFDVMGGIRVHWRFDSSIGDYVLVSLKPWKSTVD